MQTKLSQELNGMLFLQAYANKSMKQNVENIWVDFIKDAFQKNGRIVYLYNNICSLIYLHMTVPIN